MPTLARAIAAAGGGVCSGLSCWLLSSEMVLGIGLGGRSPVKAGSSSESGTGTTAPMEGAVGAGRGCASGGAATEARGETRKRLECWSSAAASAKPP